MNALVDIIAQSRSEKLRFEAAKYVLETIKISGEGGLWWVGPTTEEEIESQEHVKAVRERLSRETITKIVSKSDKDSAPSPGEKSLAAKQQ